MNQNSYYYSDVPVKVEFPDMMDGEYIIQVSVGEDHSAALSSENRLFTWGRNEWGQLGQGELAGEWVDVPTEVILSTEKVAKPAKVVAGNQHTAVLTEDGQVYTFGHNHYGQLGLGVQDVNRHMTPERVKGMSKVIDLSEGSRSDTVHAVRYDGTLWAWGDNQYGQIHSTSGQQYYYKPILAKINTDCNYYKCPSCGDIHREIDLTFQGNSAMGTIEAVCPSCGGSIDQDADLDHTDNVLAGKQILKVYDGMNHSLALLNDGHIISWGGNMYGQLGNGSVSQQQEGAWPVVVGNPGDDGMGEYVVAVSAGSVHNIVLTADQTMYVWGESQQGRLGLQKDGESIDVGVYVREPKLLTYHDTKGTDDPDDDTDEPYLGTLVAAGGSHTVMGLARSYVDTNANPPKTIYYGPLYAFGNNGIGQVGNGSNVNAEGAKPESTYLPQWVRGKDAYIKPGNIVMPVTAKMDVEGRIDKFYIANDEYHPVSNDEVKWIVVKQRDENEAEIPDATPDEIGRAHV